MRFLQKIVTFTTFHVKHLIRGDLKGFVKEKLQFFRTDRDGFLQKRVKTLFVLCFTWNIYFFRCVALCFLSETINIGRNAASLNVSRETHPLFTFDRLSFTTIIVITAVKTYDILLFHVKQRKTQLYSTKISENCKKSLYLAFNYWL